MTAKEILISKYFSDQLPIPNQEGIIEAMKEYARDKCREQREICYQNSKVVIYVDGQLEPIEADSGIVDYHSVADAPEPNFD